jgi:uncharacterized membrane protein YphA (DoxX/SURF4 family)
MAVLDGLKKYAPLVLRFGLAIVLLWFGFSQLKNPMMWTRLLPHFASSIASPVTLIYINGIFEILLATFLLLGYFTRTTSALATLHLCSIVIFAVGYGSVGTRDFGLMIAALAIFFFGADDYSLDTVLQEKKHKYAIR